MLQTGDIIFRRGNSVVSRFILMKDSNSPFSHAGIIRKVNGRAFVIHVVADETPMGQSHYDDVARMEPIESFLQTDRASLAAIYRLQDDASAQAMKASNIALTYTIQRRPFDFHFDLQTPYELYCTELVWRAYREAGIDLVDGKFDQLSMPLAKQAYILPSSLLRSHWLKLVCVLDSIE